MVGYPTFKEQLDYHMTKNPDFYTIGMDPYESHYNSNSGVWISDPSRGASRIDYHEQWLTDRRIARYNNELSLIQKEKERKELARSKNPLLYLDPSFIVSGIEQVFKNILKKSSK